MKAVWFNSLCLMAALSFSASAELANSVVIAEQDAPAATADSSEQAPLSAMDRLLEKLGADGEYDPSKPIDFSILPGPFYNPDLELGLGVAAIGLYNVDRDNPDTQLSTLTLSGFISTNGSLGMAIRNKSFLNGDRQRFYLDAEIANAPGDYYGVGYQQNADNNNRVSYDSRIFNLRPTMLTRVAPNTYLGGGFVASWVLVDEFDALDSDVDTSVLEDNSTNVGVHLSFIHDSRDVIANAYQGKLLELQLSVYREALGGDNNFQNLSLEYSYYRRLGGSRDILALQLQGDFNSGEVPWDQLAQAGGGGRLRAYTESRYRDKQLLMGQVEYRKHLTGRHGAVAWLGAGAIAPTLNELSSDELLPTAGFGYRFEVKPRMNLRLDMGFGRGENGFYFNVNEAF